MTEYERKICVLLLWAIVITWSLYALTPVVLLLLGSGLPGGVGSW